MTSGDIQAEEQSRIIFGGDRDDPRWTEFNARKAASKPVARPVTRSASKGGR